MRIQHAGISKTPEWTEARKKIKARLLDYKEAQREYENAQRELDFFKAKLEMIPVDYKQPKVKGGKKKKDLAEAIATLEEMHREADEKWEDCLTRIIAAKKLLLQVEDARKRGILFMRYFELTPWEEIAEKIKLDRRWIIRLHDQALDEIAQKQEEET